MEAGHARIPGKWALTDTLNSDSPDDADVNSWLRTVIIMPGMCPASVLGRMVTECSFQRDHRLWAALLDSYPLVGLRSVPTFILGSWHPLGSRQNKSTDTGTADSIAHGAKS